jgi:CRISPR-associated protein Cmr3
MSKTARPKYRKGKPPAQATRPAATGKTEPTRTLAVRPAAASLVLSLAPLAPIIVRSGRPFDSQAGVDPARLPPPSTIAGCLRSAWARQTGEAYSPALSRFAIAGPLLLREAMNGESQSVLVPKPADALYFGVGDTARLLRAEPHQPAPDEGTDLPQGLAVISLTDPAAAREKPGKGPAWWTLQDLLAFRSGEALTHARVEANGWSPPPGELRTHVAIAAGTQAADAGRLFQTQGLDLGAVIDEARRQRTAMQLLVRCAEPLDQALVHLGGERRLAALTPEPESLWPASPKDWSRQMLAAGGLTLTLVTPAPFAGGWLPGWLDERLTGSPPGLEGLGLQLVAAANGHWEPHSGWDLARGCPRRSRRLVPAGSTYWFRLSDNTDPAKLDALWLRSLCDDEQDRRDGFGLAVPAPWTPAIPTRPHESLRT